MKKIRKTLKNSICGIAKELECRKEWGKNIFKVAKIV